MSEGERRRDGYVTEAAAEGSDIWRREGGENEGDDREEGETDGEKAAWK